MPAHQQLYYTVDEVLAFPEDGNRYELIFGELVVSPTPRMWHQVVVMRLTRLLDAYCQREHCGEVFNMACDLSWGRRDVITHPDVFVMASEELAHGDWAKVRNVSLVVEVLSPSTARHDRFAKRVIYREQGVENYWIVDADAGIVEVWTPEAQFPVIERERLTWQASGAASAITTDLAEIFAKS